MQIWQYVARDARLSENIHYQLPVVTTDITTTQYTEHVQHGHHKVLYHIIDPLPIIIIVILKGPYQWSV